MKPVPKKPWLTLNTTTRYIWVFGTIALVFFSWSIKPVPFDYVDFDNKIVEFGADSHILPLVRIINVIFHPFRRVLIPLDPEKLRKEAIANVGGEEDDDDHHDFGTLNDWDAFDKWVTVVDESTHFSGRFLLKSIMMDTLTTHLVISKMIRDHPEILDEPIEQPIFLASCTRAGGTFLYQVLADTFNEELVPNYSYENFSGPIQLPHKPPRNEETEMVIPMLHALNPPIKLMHEWAKKSDPDEDSSWYYKTMRGVAVPFTLHSFWHHLNIYQESSASMNKNFWEIVLKLKQWKAGSKQRFFLKAPEHLFGLPYLSETFPDAKFVTASRNEVPMYKSGVLITHAWRHMVMQQHPRSTNETLAFQDMIVCQQRKALEVAHDQQYESKVMAVHFENDGLFTNTFDIVARFAKHADLPWDDAKQAHARSVIASRLSWKKHKGQYRISDFGLKDDTAIKDRLATICDDLPDTVEGLNEFYNL